MDKMTHTKFNFNNFLMGLSSAFDKVFDANCYGVDFNSQRVSYIALRLASYNFFKAEELSDIAAYALISHIDIPRKHLDELPFINKDIFTNRSIIEILKLSLFIENNIEIKSNIVTNKDKIIDDIVSSELYSSTLKESFEDLSSDMVFWLDLISENQLPFHIYNFLEDFTIEIDYEKLIKISEIINEIIYAYTNNKNKVDISYKCKKMCEIYKLDPKDSARMIIGSNLHGIGKLFISKDIHYKSNILIDEEIEMIKAIPYFSHSILASIFGFDDIAKLCSVYNERLDGTGTPYELDASSLSLKDRLIAILVIYQALLEKKVYREAFSHQEAIEVLTKEAIAKKLDLTIVEDLNKIFKEKKSE